MQPETKTTGLVPVAVLLLLLAGALGLHAAPEPGTRRTDLQRHDLSAGGREVIQVRVDFAPGAAAPMHTHPGEEIIYILGGTLEYDIAGKVTRAETGDVLFVPAETPHSARNVGSTPGAELATYIVEKGKPLLTPVR